MASSNRCSVCSKGAGTCFCPGCKAYFCDKDFRNHREMLVNQLEEITGERNELHEKINKVKSQKQTDTSILSRIDEWQQNTIEKVKQAAEQARQQILKIMNAKRKEITKEFQALSQELEELRDTEGVLEQDLARLKNQLDRLNKDVAGSSQPLTIALNTTESEKIMWNRLIYVENNAEKFVDLRPQSSLQKKPAQSSSSVSTKRQCHGHACRKCCSFWLFMQCLIS